MCTKKKRVYIGTAPKGVKTAIRYNKLLSNGTNIKNVAARLGHAQLKTTNRYVHAVEEAEKEAANTLETLLNTKRKNA